MDTIKGLALIATLIGFIATAAAWIALYEKTWAIAVSPTVASIYKARIGPSDCLAPIAWWWKRQAGCRLI